VQVLGHRKQLLHAIDELRQRVSSAAPAVGGSSREARCAERSLGGPSDAPAARQRAARQRQHIGVLEECMQRVLGHCTSLPLHSRQLLLSLWHEQRRIALAALAATEAQARRAWHARTHARTQHARTQHARTHSMKGGRKAGAARLTGLCMLACRIAGRGGAAA
jgi:hypothetical protein